MIIGMDLIKTNNIRFRWGEPDLAVVGDKGLVPVRATNDSPRIKTDIVEPPPIPVLPIKPKILRKPRRTKVNVYV